MAAPTYVIARCAVCNQQFNVDKQSDGFNRQPFVCDADFHAPGSAPAFDVRQGGMAVVSTVPAENVAKNEPITRAPLPSQPTPQQALDVLAPSFDRLLERVDPEEAARQRAVQAQDAPGTIAEPSQDDRMKEEANGGLSIRFDRTPDGVAAQRSVSTSDAELGQTDGARFAQAPNAGNGATARNDVPNSAHE